jgi:AraC-like DNA-binding protein
MTDCPVGYTKGWNFTCLEDLRNTGSIGLVSGLALDYSGIEKCESGHLYGPAIRMSYLIHVVLDGTGDYFTGHKHYHLNRNDAFLIYPGQETAYQADLEKPWHYLWVGFHGYVSEDCVRRIGFSAENPVVHLTGTSEIQACIESLLGTSQLTYSNYLLRQGEMYRFFGLMVKASENIVKEHQVYDYPQSVYVKQAIQHMTNNYREKLKIDKMAEEIGITRNYLTKSFQKELQMSPQEFLINLRLEKASKLLKNGTVSISEISDLVGYSDPLAFSKKFKEKFGMSPKAFRESHPTLIQKKKKGDYIDKTPL